MLTLQDKEFLASKGITEEQVAAQLKDLERGFPFLKLAGAAEAGKGIVVCDDAAVNGYLDTWKDYKKSNSGKIFKFVPASGAASRMFKNLFEFVDAEYDEPTSDFEKKFFAEIKKFAFYDALDKACKKTKGKNIDELVAEGSYKAVVSTLLDKDGLNYGQLPKGLLLFHSYDDGSRTPLEEHLVEGALYAADGAGNVNVHFTVSPEHRAMFEKLVAEKVKKYEDKFGVKYNVSFSEQKSSTDTVAGTMDNQPFRTGDGKILFRPGGHGALIENLNDLDADVVFIKNIDNLVPDCLKDETVKYKMVLAGLLVSLQKRAFAYLEKLDSGNYAHADLEEIIRFVQQDLCCRNPKIKELEDADLVIYLKGKLNRPIRVCGMVKNIGEPGGGPFLVYNADGTISLQILESSQIDKNNKESMEMFTKGTHFNPVDLVCSLKNYKGEKFNLSEYVDKSTGFISYKSKNGKDLKALELPGLWNGAMSNWNTVFVEVPLITFNPVKTVNDLLREQHQK
ncbi:MAG: DUF4301 family protein [Bacteroidaceae bacterium]|nr:DUF4301 family protein [Bacteroidaceae bacterium]